MNTKPYWIIATLCALLLSVAACAPSATPEPTSNLAAATTATPSALAAPITTATQPQPSPTILIYAYPGAPGHTPTPDVYPWPTQTPGPTEPPEPTEEPTPTEKPFPTLPPTPVVTPIPTAALPFSFFPTGTVAQSFTVYYREGDVINSLSSVVGATPQLFIDPLAEFGHLLPPDTETIREWGALSPDGQMLALVLTDDPNSYAILNSDAFSPAPHPTDLYLLDMASRKLRLLAPDGLLPVWSPDGRRVAYRSTETFGLWVVDVATGVVKEVYAVPPPVYGENVHFADWFGWAFDSRRLTVYDTAIYETSDLMIVDADGLEAPRHVDLDPLRPFLQIQGSPRDDRLAYLQPGPGRQPLTDLWIMNGDLTGQTQLTRDLNFASYGPLWSPDGRWMAISGLASYEAEYISYDLWLIEADSAALTRLTYETPPGSYEEYEDTGDDSSPLWTPDGTQLIFRKDSNQLWVLSLIDGGQRQLLESEDVLYDKGIIVGP